MVVVVVVMATVMVDQVNGINQYFVTIHSFSFCCMLCGYASLCITLRPAILQLLSTVGRPVFSFGI